MGSLLPLSFSEYTEFSHTQNCHEYMIDENRYLKLDDLHKIKSLKASDSAGLSTYYKLNMSGPCSKYKDQRILYTCTKHGCIFPCLCKDCVEEEGQCEDHHILHHGYFDPATHALTVRMHDSHNIGLITIRSKLSHTIEVIEYAGIEKDEIDCVKCPRDLLHHQAYHFVHHTFCKFCENEKHKYDKAISKDDCVANMKEKHWLESNSCHICKRIFESTGKRNDHIASQHSGDDSKALKCDECDRGFLSKQSLKYHKKVTHMEELEQHQCSNCDKVFHTEHGLDVHLRSVHSLRTFSCRICSSKFKRRSNLL